VLHRTRRRDPSWELGPIKLDLGRFPFSYEWEDINVYCFYVVSQSLRQIKPKLVARDQYMSKRDEISKIKFKRNRLLDSPPCRTAAKFRSNPSFSCG
jgi:hypothetical protein